VKPRATKKVLRKTYKPKSGQPVGKPVIPVTKLTPKVSATKQKSSLENKIIKDLAKDMPVQVILKKPAHT